MRRLALLGLAALALCACLLLPGLWMARQISVPVARVVAHEVLKVARPFGATRAFAGEALDFRPVPPESARMLEPSRARRASQAETPEAPAPAVPEPPVPVSPEPGSSLRNPIVVNPRSGDMMRIGQDIHVESGQTVTGDVVAIGGDIVVDGHVEGDVQAVGGDVYLNSTARVDGDVFCMRGQLHEQPGAQVGGQRVTALGRGERHAERLREEARRVSDWSHRGGRVVSSLLWLLITTGLAWGFFKLGPGRSGAALHRFRVEAGPSFLVGLLAALVSVPGLIVVALVAALLCITLIGIPVAVVLLLAYPSVIAVLWIWGFAVGCGALGQRITAARGSAIAGTAGATGAAVPSAALAAAWGALVLGGAMFVGTLFKQVPSLGLFEGLGTLIKVLTGLAIGVLSTLGAGALLREEFAHGPLRRWWNGRRESAPPAYAAPPGAPAAPGPVASAVVTPPPAPPAPPSTFLPPGDPPVTG